MKELAVIFTRDQVYQKYNFDLHDSLTHKMVIIWKGHENLIHYGNIFY